MPDAPILYRFIATGQESVQAAFKSIESAARSSSKAVEAAARQTERARGAGPGGRRAGSSAEDRQYKDAERLASKIERESKRAADAQIREASRAAAHVAGIRDRAMRDEQRAADRAAARASADDAKWKQRAISKYERAQERTKADRMRYLTRAVDTVAYTGLGLGLSAVGIGGQAARESNQLQDIATRISINARGAGQKAVDPTELRREFENAAIATPGAKATDVAEGVKAYITKTGDLDMARKLAPTFAVASVASDTSAGDIGKMSADLAEKFKITTVEEMRAAIASITFGGKAGAFEISDAADKYAKMATAGSRFGLDKGAAGVRTLQGLSQIAMGATGDRDVAATSMSAMFRQFVTEEKGFKALGVDVFTDKSKTRARPIEDLLVESITKAKGSIPKLQALFKDEGMAIPSALMTTYNDAARGAVGMKGAPATDAEKAAAGVAALKGALDKAINAPGDWAEMVKDQAAASSTAGSKMTAAWESVKAAAGEKLAPQLAILAVKLAGSDKAFSVFFAGMSAAGDALEALGALLEHLGLIDPDRKGKMGGEKEKAKAAADELAKMTADEKATPEGARKEAELITAKSMAEERASVLAQAQAKEDLQAKFAADYMNAANPSDLADKEGRGQTEMKARALASSLMRDPTDMLASSDFMQKLGGENEAQAALRKQYQGDVAAGPSAGADDLKKAAAELTTAARALQAGQSNGGSILGATTQ